MRYPLPYSFRETIFRIMKSPSRGERAFRTTMSLAGGKTITSGRGDLAQRMMAFATVAEVWTDGLGASFRPRGFLAASKNSVAVPTGQMRLTAIPLPSSSRRSDSESPTKANLLAQ